MRPAIIRGMDTFDSLREHLESFRRASLGDVELFYSESDSTKVTVRDRKVDSVVESRSRGLGVRALRDGRMAFTHTTDLSPGGIEQARDALKDFLDVTEPDEHNHFALPADYAPDDLELADAGARNADTLIERALAMAEAALAVDDIALAETTASAGSSRAYLLNSLGVEASEEGTGYRMFAEAHAHKGDLKETAYSYCAARHSSGLFAPARIGTEAGEWARDRLGAEPLKSAKRPVVFMPMAAGMMLDYYAAALNGEMINLGASYMVGKLGEKIGSELVRIVEDPLMVRGLESTRWDGEGVPARRKDVLAGGTLNACFHNLYSAAKAGATPGGNASRGGYTAVPRIGAFNLHIANGDTQPEELLSGISDGLLVYSLMGHGPDMASGTFSSGASGWHIADGKIAGPVSKVTIAGDMLQILADIDGVGNDLDLARPYSSPTLRVREMSVSGT